MASSSLRFLSYVFGNVREVMMHVRDMKSGLDCTHLDNFFRFIFPCIMSINRRSTFLSFPYWISGYDDCDFKQQGIIYVAIDLITVSIGSYFP